jgi:hypothetical protein
MRIVLTTRKTEEREDNLQRRYQDQEDQRLAEESRRSDVGEERAAWSNTLQTRLEQGIRVSDAIRDADEVLEAYRKRFQ